MGGHTERAVRARGEAPWRELELLVDSGFTPLEAITAATGTAAGFLYRDDELGTLRPGLQADLVVLAAIPRATSPRSAPSSASWSPDDGSTWASTELLSSYQCSQLPAFNYQAQHLNEVDLNV